MTKSIIYFFLLAIAPCCSSKSAVKQINNDTSIVVTSHRGYGGLYPENTILGIKEALKLGVHRIEIDVHQTKDSVLVLMHDTSIDRTTYGSGKIKEFSFDELKKHKIPNAGNDESIPSLEEVIQLVNGGTSLLIEIKKGNSYYPGIEKNIVELIKKHNAIDWCIIQSFDDDILLKINDLEPQLELHKLLFFTLNYSFEKKEHISEFSIYHRFVNEKIIDKIHELQKKVNAWTVNYAKQINDLKNMGVDGIITDHPELIKQIKD